MITILYRAIDFVSESLRRKVERETWLWKRLSAIRAAFASLRDNPINKHAWKSNKLKFETLIEDYAQQTPDFFVLQIGACDGVMDDPIHHLIRKHEWRGLLVEPQKEEYERLKSAYRGCKNLCFENSAISETCDSRAMYKIKNEHIEADWQRGVASFLRKPKLENLDKVTIETVQCISFDVLLKRHAVSRIDLLQIDVEGYDYQLLKLFDFKQLQPRLIRYEHRHLGLSDRRACRSWLIRNGYKIMGMKYDTGAVLQRDF